MQQPSGPAQPTAQSPQPTAQSPEPQTDLPQPEASASQPRSLDTAVNPWKMHAFPSRRSEAGRVVSAPERAVGTVTSPGVHLRAGGERTDGRVSCTGAPWDRTGATEPVPQCGNHWEMPKALPGPCRGHLAHILPCPPCDPGKQPYREHRHPSAAPEARSTPYGLLMGGLWVGPCAPKCSVLNVAFSFVPSRGAHSSHHMLVPQSQRDPEGETPRVGGSAVLWRPAPRQSRPRGRGAFSAQPSSAGVMGFPPEYSTGALCVWELPFH